MKIIFSIAVLTLMSNLAIAQTADDCQDMVKLRNRSGSLNLTLNRVDAGIDLSLIQNGDFTSQLMTVLLFENYMCRLNQVLIGRGQAPISRDVLDTWVEEINSAYTAFDEAKAGKLPSTLKSDFNKASRLVSDSWKAAGARTAAHQVKLPVDVSQEFLAAVPAMQLTTNTKIGGTLYLKAAINKGFAGTYETQVAQGEALVGNQLWALQSMRTSVGVFAKGQTPASSMLRDVTAALSRAVAQITDRESTALVKEQMRIEAEVKHDQAAQLQATQKIAELEKRIVEVEKKIAKTN